MTLAESIFANQEHATRLQPLSVYALLYICTCFLLNTFIISQIKIPPVLQMPMTAFISDNSVIYIGMVKGERFHGNKAAHTNQGVHVPFYPY